MHITVGLAVCTYCSSSSSGLELHACITFCCGIASFSSCCELMLCLNIRQAKCVISYVLHTTQRPPIPESCELYLKNLMECCWQENAKVSSYTMFCTCLSSWFRTAHAECRLMRGMNSNLWKGAEKLKFYSKLSH